MSAEAAFLPVARGLALQAGRRIHELMKTELVRTRKADKSLVTNADHEANDILRNGLRKAFPTHSIVSEETPREGPASEYVWLIDPLDGTKAYARGEPGFSVMVGLLKDEKPVLGVVYDPLEGHLYEAAKGAGCFYSRAGEGRAGATVSERRDWGKMPVITSTGFPQDLREKMGGTLSGPWLPPINSVGIKVGYLVRRLADVYVNHHPVHFWDTCAPGVILAEAGGRMTQWDGSPLAYRLDGDHRHPGPTAATNGTRHEDLLEALKGITG